ncbi:MAG: hypothetical protein M3065_09985 [Actinomycetota bacterium]|nr:hypothetical protein [Actinomycetota bacterium]
MAEGLPLACPQSVQAIGDIVLAGYCGSHSRRDFGSRAEHDAPAIRRSAMSSLL